MQALSRRRLENRKAGCLPNVYGVEWRTLFSCSWLARLFLCSSRTIYSGYRINRTGTLYQSTQSAARSSIGLISGFAVIMLHRHSNSLRQAAMLRRKASSSVANAPRAISTNADALEYDYVIVGGGSAGCVLANRLTENPGNKVLLVETGPSDVNKWDSWKIHMPAALTYNLADDKYNWCYYTEPQKNLDNRRLPWPRGRVLGGSSSLNAMVYIRGHAQDYDDWHNSGAEGWSYADCLPYFRKAQNHELGADDYRGGDGPLHVTRGTQKDQILFKKFIDAGVQAGYPFTEDMNGYQQEGFGWMDSTVYKGKRWSTASAYLRPAMARKNLTVMTDTLVNKVLFDGKTAVGIETENNKTKAVGKVLAGKEVCSHNYVVDSWVMDSLDRVVCIRSSCLVVPSTRPLC